ncbi:MAG: SH3 domain-containing protein [Parvularcula sp.]|jgi:SH3-like domain-containing protein|nr:SH3 domain-containing protein [Parvularcula sp.]
MRAVWLHIAIFCFMLGGVLSAAALAADDDLSSEAIERETRLGFSGLPVPRFVALKKDKVYGRAAPEEDVVVIYQRKGLPLKVIAESADNVWRRVEDHQGRRVWIHRQMLAENKHVVLRSSGILFAEPDRSALPRARLEGGVMAELRTCTDDWCQVKTRHFAGWTDRGNLWGSPL